MVNQEETKAEQEPAESLTDLELTNQQAAETKAGKSTDVQFKDLIISSYQTGGGHG